MQRIAEYLVNNFEKEQEKVYEVFEQKIAYVEEIDGKKYFAYVMQDRVIITKEKERADIVEILFFELEEELPKVIEPYEVIEKAKQKYKVGKIANKIFPYTEVQSIEEVADRIPQPKIKIQERY